MGKMDGRERQKKTQFSDSQSVNMKMSSLMIILSGQINVLFLQFCRQHKSNDLASSAITITVIIYIKDNKAWEREFFSPSLKVENC